MTNRALSPHPLSPRGPATSISVDVERPSLSIITLRYQAIGSIAEIAAPARSSPKRADELWRRTCFEAFLRPKGEEEYFEFNFSPSTQWAAYHFKSYRAGMSIVNECPPPAIKVLKTESELALAATLDLNWMDATILGDPLRLALSAIIEEKSGPISYWALVHAPGKPDFHHPTSFACDLKREY